MDCLDSKRTRAGVVAAALLTHVAVGQAQQPSTALVGFLSANSRAGQPVLGGELFAVVPDRHILDAGGRS